MIEGKENNLIIEYCFTIFNFYDSTFGNIQITGDRLSINIENVYICISELLISETSDTNLCILVNQRLTISSLRFLIRVSCL